MVLVSAVAVYSCSKQGNTVVIWTDQGEFASYAELFNASQDRFKAIVQYQKSPASAFPPVKGEQVDILIGPWLKNEKVRKNFLSLDYLFDDIKLSAKDFYPQLLQLGNIQEKQYLLPVSFNLPLVIFSSDNQQYITDNFMLSIDELREAGSRFNVQTKNGAYTAMGFSPRWFGDFMYVVSRLFGTAYAENETLFSYNSASLAKTVRYLRDWSREVNTSTAVEDDFQFKYLYNPSYKLVTEGRCLFAYMKSDEFFTLPTDRLQNIDFRWIHNEKNIAVADKLVYMGIYKKTRNLDAAQAFLLWFLNEKTQKQLLERSAKMNLSTKTFGIAGGFSSLRTVTERTFPVHYGILYGHLPPAEYLSTPNILPAKWEDIKARVIVPYLEEAVTENENAADRTLDRRIQEWIKQNY